MSHYIGIDFGGTNLRAAIADTDTGQIFHQQKRTTLASEGQEAVIGRIVELIRELIHTNGAVGSIKGVGIGVPGTPDLDAGVIQLLPNLPGKWVNVPLQSIVEEEVRLPVALINDVRAITLGEWTFGAGRGAQTIACLAIGTGIGGGVVINGEFHLGIGGTAGEFGHHVVEIDGLPCGCGGKGCLELYASGPAIAAMGVKEVMHGHTTRIGELVNHDLNRIDAGTIVQAALDVGDRHSVVPVVRATGAGPRARSRPSMLPRDPRLRLSIRLRNPYVDPISLLQVELLRRWRAGGRQDDGTLRALFATVNGIAAGIQNTG